MNIASGHTGHWPAEHLGGGAAALAEGAESAGNTWDAMEVYFECITTCSLEDGECVTRCVEELRERV
jgi:hypothetical protein